MINVLDTHAPSDGANVLIVNGYDNTNPAYSGATGQTDDIFLLRKTAFIASPTSPNTPNAIADDPAFVALLHGKLGEPITAFTGSLSINVQMHTFTAAAGSFSALPFAIGRRIRVSGAGIYSGDYTIQGISLDGSILTIAETIPSGVSLTTEEVPTGPVAVTGITIGVLTNDVTTSDPSGDSSVRVQAVERINYDTGINGRLNVNGLGGNDYFAMDDNSATTTLDGGNGNNTFQIGQIYGLFRDSSEICGGAPSSTCPVNSDLNLRNTHGGSLAPQDVFGTVATTRGWLSRGNSQPVLAEGGTGDDTFVVYSNQAPLRLEGIAGNNLFIVRGFALAQTTLGGTPGGTPCDPNTDGPTCEIVWLNAQTMIAMPKLTSGFSTAAESDIRTGSGQNQVMYNMNAPVSVDGGTGFNKLIILGTEYADHIVVTAKAVYGVGLWVTYVHIQVLEIDTLEATTRSTSCRHRREWRPA